MIDRRIKTIIVLLLCLNITTAQQIPNELKEFQTTLKKWQEKMKQFNAPALRNTQEYFELRKEMRNELKQTSQNEAPLQQIAIPDSLSANNNQTFPLPNTDNQNDSLAQFAQPLITANAEKVITSSVCYNIPFASKDNVIELSVANSSSQATEEVKVNITNVPEWLKFEKKKVEIPALKSKEEQTVSFTFSVDKSAQVGKEQTLSFTVTAKNGQNWTKEIKVNITPPATYELFQNYPNPYNPTTTINYQLSAVSKVNLKVYDMLGREVANLVNEQQEPGSHQTNFDAHRYASGIYMYQLVVTDEQNNQHVFRKKMILLK